jgi:hypothetical protein
MKSQVALTKKLLLASSFLGLSLVAGMAEANYGQQGFFTGRTQPDGSIDLRNPVGSSGSGAVAGQSIAQRPRPEFDPTPIDVGSFQLFPSIEAGVVYDSNIFSQKSGEKGDYVWTVRPAVSLFSNWGRHALSLGAQGDFGFFTIRPRENYYNGVLNMSGRFDLANRTTVDYGADYQRLSEERGGIDSLASALEPTTLNYYRFYSGFVRKQGRFDLRSQYSFRRFDYDQVETGLGNVNLDFRNKQINQITSELGYEVMRFWRPFIRGGYNWRDFPSNAQQNSQGYDVVAGTGYEFGGGTVTGEVYAGYLSQTFRNWDGEAADNGTHDFKFGGNFLWNVTGLTSVLGEFDRNIEDTTTTGYRSFIATGGSLTVQHELRRNLLLEAKGGYTRYDYNGAPERFDHNYDAGAGARYFFNRHFYGDLQYDFADRTSSISDVNYGRHVVQLRFGARM